MNEIAKNYYETVNERSITAKSSHAKNGGNSEKLGNRQLTIKEIEERHGPVRTYTFDDFLSFSEFREMPLDWQAGYINHLQDKYDINLLQIGRDLFGQRDDNVLRSHLKIKGILDKVNPDKRRGRTKLHEFRRDIRAYRMRPTVPEEKPKQVQTSLPMFMDMESFKNLSPDQQKIFIKRLLDEYKIGLLVINQELFGRPGSSLSNYLISRHFSMEKDFGIKRGGNKRGPEHDANLARFRRDIAEWRKGKVCSEVANAVGLPEEILKNAPNPPISISEAFSKVAEAAVNAANKMADTLQPIAETIQKGEIITVNDVNKELGFDPVPEEKNEVIAKPPVFKTKQKVFSTSYIGDDINMAEILALRKMFAGQKIQVEITVTTDSLMGRYE